jgi:hypothetical protein
MNVWMDGWMEALYTLYHTGRIKKLMISVNIICRICLVLTCLFGYAAKTTGAKTKKFVFS